MAETGTHQGASLSGRDRLMAATTAVGLWALLATAALLKPDPRGLGTHQQFGLPPCTFRVLFGRPCPSCGMTTSWAYLVRGKPTCALCANVGGALLGILAIVAGPWLLVSAVRGRWLGWVPNQNVVVWVAWGLVLVTLVGWIFRLLNG